MANERIHRVRVLKTAVTRLFLSGNYCIKVICAAMLAFVSPYILEMFGQAAKMISPQIVEAFHQGTGYNIGVLKVSSLDILNEPYCDRIITGVLSGSLSHCIIATVAAGFIKREFLGGYIVLAIMHGQSRTALYAKYTLVSIIAIILPVIAYPMGVYISLLIRGAAAVENAKNIIGILFLQIYMLAALTVCFSSLAIMFDGRGATAVCLCLVISLPYVPNYLSIFTSGKVDIEKYMLLSRLVNSGNASLSGTGEDILIATVTAAVCYCLGWIVFANKNFN